MARCNVPLDNGISFLQIYYSKSEMSPITCGVPLISTLGLLLYLLYKNIKKKYLVDFLMTPMFSLSENNENIEKVMNEEMNLILV